MEIEVNFTIVIQIINFLIAYFLITRFFIRPAMEVFNNKSNEQKDISNQIRSLDHDIQKSEFSINRIWDQAKQKFHNYILSCSFGYRFKKLEIYSISEKKIDKREEEKLVTEICQKLTQEIEKC